MTFLRWCIRKVFEPLDAHEDELFKGALLERRIAERRRGERRANPTTTSTRKEASMDTRPYRQGDVLIKPVASIPKQLKKVPLENGRVVLAHGEATGHAHCVEGDVEFLAADLQEMEGRFLLVEAEAHVVHDEHATITLPPGEYEVIRQREYQPEAPTWVAD